MPAFASRSVFVALLGGALMVLAWPASVRAQKMPVAPRLQVPILMKVLAYDRQFANKAKDQLTIGIVYRPSSRSSALATDQISDTLYGFAGKTVRRLPIRYFQIEYTGPEALERFARDKGVSVFYVAPDNASALADILRVAQANSITTMTGVPEYVRRGVSVGIAMAQNRPQILINLPASKSEGSEFDANLLRLARVLK